MATMIWKGRSLTPEAASISVPELFAMLQVMLPLEIANVPR